MGSLRRIPHRSRASKLFGEYRAFDLRTVRVICRLGAFARRLLLYYSDPASVICRDLPLGVLTIRESHMSGRGS